MQAEPRAHVVSYSAGGLRWRRAKAHWRGEAQSEYKQILFPFWTDQRLNTDLDFNTVCRARGKEFCPHSTIQGIIDWSRCSLSG